MKNNIITRAEQLGHEVEGLHYFFYDVRASNPTITEKIMGKFKQVKHYKSDDETTYLVFEDDTSKLKPAYGLSFVEKLLSGEVFDFQIFHVCRDRAKLVALIKKEWDEGLRRKQLETVAAMDWEGRTWQLACDIYLRFDGAVMDASISEAKEFVKQYRKSLEEEL